MLCFPTIIFAQTDSLKVKIKKNEITFNAFEVIVAGTLPISYERFINNNQSITVKAFLFDKPYADIDFSGDKVISIQAQYNLYLFEKKPNSGLFFSFFLKNSNGTYPYELYYFDKTTGKSYTETKTEKVNAFILGVGVGYKWLWKNKLSFGLNADLGRALNRQGYYYYKNYGPAEVRAGLNVGVRF